MKKSLLFLICLFIGISFVFSQNLKIYQNGNILTNNQVLNITGDVNELITLSLHLKNISTSTINVKLKKLENSIVLGSENSFCYAGQCYSPTTMVSLDSSVIPANTFDTTFLADYGANGKSGTSKITYVFFNTANLNDSVCVIVNYTTAVGINTITKSEVNFSDAFPNPANNSVSFNYELPKQTTTAKIKICNILGSCVAEIDLTEHNGKKTLNTSELNNGIYFYSLILNNKLFYTRKIVIKH